MKTVELIEDEHDWQPDRRRIPANKIVKTKVAYGEINIGRMIRNVGGKWNREEGFWELPYFHAVNLGLEDRVHFDENG